MTTNTKAMRAAPVLVRDLAEIIGKLPVEVCVAMRDLGFKPMRSVNMEVSGEEALAVAKHFAALAQAEQRQEVTEDQARDAFWGCYPEGPNSDQWMTAFRWARFKYTGRLSETSSQATAPHPEEPKQHAPFIPDQQSIGACPQAAEAAGLCLESGEFVPADKLNAAPQLAQASIDGMADLPAILRGQAS